MKTTRSLKVSWFLAAMAAGIVFGELMAWNLAHAYGLRFSPLPVAFLCVGLVEMAAAIIYRDADIG